MTNPNDLRSRLRNASKQSAKDADHELRGELDKIKQANVHDLEALKPRISDPEVYEVLLGAVRNSTSQNEDIVLFQQRLKVLGSKALDVAKEASGLL
jgi:hypothetical protein